MGFTLFREGSFERGVVSFEIDSLFSEGFTLFIFLFFYRGGHSTLSRRGISPFRASPSFKSAVLSFFTCFTRGRRWFKVKKLRLG